ncbi:MAG: SpvB/TcaC N-terminal domain-containing protein [Archangium sp.]|nr:SpvB/TcaC N-terminal domain-containing protein [Archangium sp.]
MATGKRGPEPRSESTEGAKEPTFPALAPSLALPKGGGAIRGMGEKFAANPVTGTGRMTVPVPTSPGRGNFGPQLSLSYDSGAGNGPFGFGWALSLPSVTRKTEKGLPRYDDAGESDVYLLSGAEDLVPELAGQARFEETRGDYLVHRYRPRIEGLFARIERWTHATTQAIHWRSISKENITSLYGNSSSSRIEDGKRVFSWLLSESYDDKGNAIFYEYAAENDAGVDKTLANERNRARGAARYLKRVKYGNRTSTLAPNNWVNDGWLFELVLDYEEGHSEALAASDPPRVRAASTGAGPWSVRPDPFSSHRAGFEVRTYRRCRRMLMFHHFAALGATPCLVRSLELDYADLSYAGQPAIDAELAHPGSTRFASFIVSMQQAGYVRDGADTYVRKTQPRVEFEYSKARLQDDVRTLAPGALENLPIGIDGRAYQWVDLDGEGLSGVLTEQGGAWFYKRNLGEGRFGPARAVPSRPSVFPLTGGGTQLLDLSGNGQLDVVSFGTATPGFFQRTQDECWEEFRTFKSLPRLRWDDPRLRFVDLDGDGRADILIAEDNVFDWHSSLGDQGFTSALRVTQPRDEELGPRLVFNDATESVFLADFCGDGLTDLVRVRSSEVCYWPNLGYGRFGPKVTLDNSPAFDSVDQFDPRRIRLADIDGSGATDIIYLHRDGARVYFNQSGNRLTGAKVLHALPPGTPLHSVMTADLLGNGTACLVWSSPLPGDALVPVRYLDLMGGQKPHLLTTTRNNLGAETTVEYASSTRFYLADKAAGTPWVTKLPYPVHVVTRVTTHDAVTQNRFATRYSYHHGHFDGGEREFRGFGRVDSFDTEEYSSFAQLPAPISDLASHVPPVLTKTWFHTGICAGRDVSRHLATEYYAAPGLSDSVLPGGLTVEEEAEACRALKGSMLRQEVYALDGSPRAATPYTVVEQSFTLKALQRKTDNRHGVFFAHPREALTQHYERNADDPRVVHTLTLDVDGFGNVRKALSVGYGRRKEDSSLTAADKTRQSQRLLTYTEAAFTNAVETDDAWRTPLPAAIRTWELTGFAPTSGARFSVSEWVDGNFALLNSAQPVEYTATPDPLQPQKRPIEDVRTLYRANDLSALLAAGVLESRALPGESFKLALTSSLVSAVFASKLPNPGAVLEATGADGGGYALMDGAWWLHAGRPYFDAGAGASTPAVELAFAQQHFFTPHSTTDAFGERTTIEYDAFSLLPTGVRDALDNEVRAENDYRVLQPWQVTDANGNRTAAAFDALGLVVATAVRGKANANEGDELSGFSEQPTLDELRAFIAAPAAEAASLLGQATSRLVYDVDRFARCGQPAFVATLARETHLHPANANDTAIQISFSFSDGFGREVQKKVQAEPGIARTRASPVLLPSGDLAPGPLQPGTSTHDQRWVGTGRVVFNNKGKPVKQHEPFFSATHLCEEESEVTDTGVSPVLFYDPVGRVVATLHPNHAYEKVVFDNWRQATWDANDTSSLDPRTDPDIAGFVARYFEAQPAGWQTWAQRQLHADTVSKTRAHAETPSLAWLDVQGRVFLTVADDGTVKLATRVDYDIEGNERAVSDALGRVVVKYDYDLLGSRLHQATMEAGERWTLDDAAGKPLRSWDSRGFARRMTYDELRRPTGLHVTEAGVERLAEKVIYGESLGASAAATNHRTRVLKSFDAAGVVTSEAFDFKGNALASSRAMAVEYKAALDWSASPALDEVLGSSTAWDALNRPFTVTSPDGSIYSPTFNEAGLLESIDVRLRGASTPTPVVVRLAYDARGRREAIGYANGATTEYTYDAETLRLTRLRTTRPGNADTLVSQLFASGSLVQDLSYSYDAVGNITRLADAALKTQYNSGAIAPECAYTYDALYRLIEATGRESIGQTELAPTFGNPRDFPFLGSALSPNDLQALRRFTESYVYDDAGNMRTLAHAVSGGGWTRHFTYEEHSQLEAGQFNNRLSSTTVNAVTVTSAYDVHGNMLALPHVASMGWSFKDEFQTANLGGGRVAHYVSDAAGQRVRKVIETNGVRRQERLSVGRFEVWREFRSDGVTVETERETLHLMDDKQRVALVETLTVDSGGAVASPTPRLRYQFGNHLGSSSLELSESAALISYEEYHPYGTSALQAHSGSAEVSVKRYRYTAKERDDETGLNYHGARYYASWLARWTSADPLGVRAGQNLYLYCRCEPLGRLDADGRDDTPANASSDWWAARFQYVPFLVPVPPVLTAPQGPFLFRGTDSFTDPLPTLRGLLPRNAAGAATPLQHVLGQTSDSPWISTSTTKAGASAFGRSTAAGASSPTALKADSVVAIDPSKLGPENTVISNSELKAQMKAAMATGEVPKAPGETWLHAQDNPHGTPSGKVAAPEGETLVRGPVPPEAVQSVENLERAIVQAAKSANQAKWVGRINSAGKGLGVAGLVVSAVNIGVATQKSVETGDPRHVENAVLTTTAGFGGSALGAKIGMFVGAAGGPIGVAVGGVVGGVLGGVVSSWYADKKLQEVNAPGAP